jgi:hypothetical protein
VLPMTSGSTVESLSHRRAANGRSR